MYICVQSRCIVDSQNMGEIPKCILFCNYKKKCDSGVHVCVCLCVCVVCVVCGVCVACGVCVVCVVCVCVCVVCVCV